MELFSLSNFTLNSVVQLRFSTLHYLFAVPPNESIFLTLEKNNGTKTNI